MKNAWTALKEWAGKNVTKRNAMYAAAAIAILGAIAGLTLGSGWLWFTVGAQGYLLAFGTSEDWR